MASSKFPVAVIGVGVRLPGAQCCDEFWELMVDGKDTVSEFPAGRANDIAHVVKSFKGKLVDEDKPFFTGSFFNEVDKFDADVFQINPGEALFIEPEQRIFLEVTWELLEDAGYASKIKGSRTGVYVGNTVNKYKYILTENHPSISHGNHSPFISSRVSYTHDLQGPAMMIATGCSSSLLAVHVACQGLLSGDCDMAIAGGITLDLLPISTKTDIWNQLGITGPNVKCRAFDESAKGIAKGEGCGVVLLKPLSKALQENDFIYGVLEATTANQDGHSNGITAPHPVAQANMLNQAWKLAGVNPKDLDYFEAHGTGTELGDPIEISGITNAFKKHGISFPNKNVDKIPIGSVKANIGHLADGAAGVVSLIKTLLCMNRNKIPRAVNFTKPNTHINWEKSPVYVNQDTLEWTPHANRSPRIASVSAFGLLGTNVHAVVKECVYKNVYRTLTKEITVQEGDVQVMTLSANTKESLMSFVHKLILYFQSASDTSYTMLRNVCYSINTGREHTRFKFRAIVCGENWRVMLKSLQQLLTERSSLEHTTQVWYAPNQCDLTDANFLEANVKEILVAFIQGKHINWDESILFQGAKKIPFLPTYAFEAKRFWPSGNRPINGEQIHLEHQLKETDISAQDSELQGTNQEMTQDKASPVISLGAGDIVANALQSVLGTSINWKNNSKINLFTLGLDSLMLSQVCMIIQSKTDCPISLTTLHQNPTFTGLKTLVADEMNKDQTTLKKDKRSSDMVKTEEVQAVMMGVLNSVLGKELDWQNISEENLYTLGVDSLMSTHINMRLTNVFGMDATFTMAELHEKTTFTALCKLMKQKVADRVLPTPMSSTLEPPQAFSPQSYFPVSHSQKRLWVMQEMVGNHCAYNATNCIKITGNFHHAAFVHSVNVLLSKHDAFFTEFVESTSGVLQRHTHPPEIEEVCLRSKGRSAEELAMELYEEDYAKSFDLKQGPLVRCKLYLLPHEVYFFTMVIHHIVFDGWSHFVFYNELWNTYENMCNGHQIDKIAHRPFYVEVAEEEQNKVAALGTTFEKDLAYWKMKLAEPLPHTTFPGDKRRPPVFTYNGGRITRFIADDIVCGLGKFSADKNTMFMTLLSAVYVLLYRYTGENDFIIGTPIAGRADLRYKNVIGCFINTLCLRVHINGSHTLKDVLKTVAETCVEGYEHQHTPFDHLVSQLNLPRNTSITPVFGINVCYHNTEDKTSHVNPPSDISVERRLLHNNSSKWDMQFDFLQESEGMRFTLEYYSDVFSETYAEGIVNSFVTLLKSMCSQPNARLGDLQLLEVSCGDSKEFPRGVSIMRGPETDIGSTALPQRLLKSLFDHENTSKVYDTDLSPRTYKTLLNKAEKVAVFLRNTCNNPKQSRIGLLLDNSIEALESILACMCSGLVYVPLDTQSPKTRLEHICRDAEVRSVIFSHEYSALANHLHWTCKSVKTIICIDDKQAIPDEESPQATLMDTELWDCVASEASNEIEGGGWKSSYTGEYMSKEEMDEYSENVQSKLQSYLKTDSEVLEVGCASGLTTKMIHHSVKHYVATDLSRTMIENLRNVYKEKTNMEFHCVPAHRIDQVCKGKRFDVIIMNSVVHCFPNYNYFRDVMSLLKKLLSDQGVIFIGDIMDLDCKEKLEASLRLFKESHPLMKVKTEWHNELFLSREFLQHLCQSLLPAMEVTFSRKLNKIPNELTEFRFDAIIKQTSQPSENVQQCNAYTIFDIENGFEGNNPNEEESLHSVVRNWSSDIDFKDEAYILFTSGTTGVPKGVIIHHGALLNYVIWACNTYRLDDKTCLPLFSPLTFDFTVTSVFPPLLSGSTIRIFRSFQESYQDIATCENLTLAKFSPLQLDTILSVANKPLSASTYILGGEDVTSSLLLKLKENKPGEEFVVWNEYGPTEATVGCVVKALRSDDISADQHILVPIGKPIDNVTVVVVGNDLRPVPIGGKGTLAIGGESLCSGFTANTSGSALKAACWGRPGDLMLVTDDLVEVMPASMDIVCFGRKESDSSKVNGIRVDCVEIQQALETSYMVDSAWVITFVHESKEYLGAALKIKSASKDNLCDSSWKSELISTVSHLLPARFIPNVFVPVTDPPTNRNGKKDKQLLQRLFSAEIKQALPSAKRRSESSSLDYHVTNKLQDIWRSVLPIDCLPAITDNFFYDLSGDSLQAIHVTRKMRAEGFHVSVADIFKHPTIERLIPIVTDQVTPAPDYDDIEDGTTFKPTPIIEEFLKRSSQCHDRFSLSALLKFQQLQLDAATVKTALRSVMKKHGSLRSRFELHDEKARQTIFPLQRDAPEVKEISITSAEDSLTKDVQFVDVCDELEKKLSLSGVMVSSAVITFHGRGNQGQSIHKLFLLLAVHHVATDIVSWQQILEDLSSALKLVSTNRDKEPFLPSPSTSFQTYCNLLHAQAHKSFSHDVPYWVAVGENCKMGGTLNANEVKSKFESVKWANRTVDADVLRTISSKLTCSDEHVLLAVFGRALSLVHGESKTAVCLESHGRQLEGVDATDVVGWCTSKFPFVIDTTHERDLAKEVKSVEENIKSIPNRGLSFGVLKASEILQVPYPRIMFVFQGSLDASTKTIYDGGNFQFEHVPWIEVMNDELNQDRFHRDPEELLEFDLEIISWIHNGKLQMGCLFDKCVIHQDVEEILTNAQHMINLLFTKIHAEPKTLSVAILSSFNITPECVATMKESLQHHDMLVSNVDVYPPDQMIQSLYTLPKCDANTIVVVPRFLSSQLAAEFVDAYSQISSQTSKEIVILTTNSISKTQSLEKHKLQETSVIFETPAFIGANHYDDISDEMYQMPFTPTGYVHFGLTIARAITAVKSPKRYKAIAVDADYTLWEGECAQGQVMITQDNASLQRFLVKQKEQGMLLVILSKNTSADVEAVFTNHSQEMILKQDDFVAIIANWETKAHNLKQIATNLNIRRDSFVFIDDNPLECEAMLRTYPEVLTLQLPDNNSDLIVPLIENLWTLDNVSSTTVSTERTAMYRSEFARQEELHAVENHESNNDGVTELLKNWKMRIQVCKSTVAAIKSSRGMCSRVEELLQRTNQFKLNNKTISLEKINPDSQCWLVALNDSHGSYGIISVCIFTSSECSRSFTLTQWVLSCRALGRYVEHRILMELLRDNESSICLEVSDTSRNTPMLNFLGTLGVTDDSNLVQLRNADVQSKLVKKFNSRLHDVIFKSLDEFEAEWCIKSEKKVSDQSEERDEPLPPSIDEVTSWVKNSWSALQKHQCAHHNLYPIIPSCSRLRSHNVANTRGSLTQRTSVLKEVWMDVLQSRTEPQEQANFLECGGNSFKAVFLVSKLRRLCHIDITIMDILRNPVYHQMKTVVQEAQDIEGTMSQVVTCSRASFPSSFPLTSAQKRMVLLQQASPDSTAYVETVACSVSGHLESTKVINELTTKHPMLTAKITVSDNIETYTMTMTADTIPDTEPEILEGSVSPEEYIRQSIPVIGVISCPLFKFRHIISSGNDSFLVLHIHHVIVDDVTLRILQHDMQAIANGIEENERSQLRHYSDYVTEERMYNTSVLHDEDMAFWTDIFADLPPESSLSIQQKSDGNQANTTVFPAQEKVSNLEPETVKEIRKFCRVLGITEFQYFLACTSLVLERYLGVDDFFIAIPVTTRSDLFAEVDGLFINTLLYRMKVNRNQTLEAHVKFVGEEWLKVQTHSQYPLDQITKTIWKDHGRSLQTLCCAMFNYTTQTRPTNSLRVGSKHAKMPLSIDILYDEEKETYKMMCEFSEGLIDSGIAERLFDSVVQLCSKGYELEGLLSDIEILSNEELQLLQSFTENEEYVDPVDPSIPIHSDFEKHALQDSRRIAVVCEGHSTTYGELYSMSCRIAYYLRVNIPAEELRQRPVIIVMEKTQYAVACMFGVWKAGGHFLPVALSNDACLKDIFERQTPAALLYHVQTAKVKSVQADCKMWCIVDILNESAMEMEGAGNFKANDTAYIIRTSGSTGKPKQCLISHRGLRAVSQAWRQSYSMSSFEVNVLQWAPLSFDVFIGDIVRALVCVQGKVVLCPDDRRLDIPYILDLIRDHRITMIETTPHFGSELVDNADDNDLQFIKILILGSDVLQKHTYEHVKRRLTSEQRLVNSYGMTEATIDSSFFEGNSVPKTRSGTVPIGKPLPGIVMQVLDPKTHQPCPVGTTGELYISGDVLATGDVEIVEVNGHKALKTGDSACWLPTGDLELLGRLDSVVKLRGFRISTTEIENKIVSLVDGVKEAHVTIMTEGDKNGVEFLCAYVLLEDGFDQDGITFQHISKQLRGEVPYYMLPDRTQVIQQVPLTAHGKVNKKALPKITRVPAETCKVDQSSLDSRIISKLKDCLAEALQLADKDQIQADVSFMEQGVHSLVLVRFWSLLVNRYSINVEISDLFSYSTIYSLADHLENESKGASEGIPLPISLQEKSDTLDDVEIAITGIAMRLPGGIMSLSELWKVLLQGEDLIESFPECRKQDVLKCMSLSNSTKLRQTTTFEGAFLTEIDKFDHRFFKIAPGEAKFMSPEQRLFLQVATEALADGTSLSTIKGAKVGVFVGSSEVGYAKLEHPDTPICISGLMPGMIATRVAYQWDLKGPTMLVDTACSSSLIALKHACEAIKKRECNGALVGGVNIQLYPSRTGVHGQTSILSPDFHCKPFDKNATGTAVGEGVMCMYIEPLEDALRKRKPVYAIVKGVASNNVGHGNGITAPSATSQAQVIQEALGNARLQPSDINFVEAHGTGTNLGDRIELAALSDVFDQDKSTGPLPVGAVKSIFGHLDSAAGLLGLFKVLACMTSKVIAPTANFKSPHPEITRAPLYVPSAPCTWYTNDHGMRVAGVSAFGLTGTNCHAILSECKSSVTTDRNVNTVSSSFSLLFVAETVHNLAKQAALYKAYADEMIVNLEVSTIQGLCVSVAQKLKDYQEVQESRDCWRMVVTTKSVEQLTKLLPMIISSTDADYLMHLSDMRSDICLWHPSYKATATNVPADVHDFLKTGTIDLGRIFHGLHNHIQPALGVQVAIYHESRHWLETVSSSELHYETEGDIVDLFHEKLINVRETVRTLQLSPTEELEMMQRRFCSAVIIQLLLTTGIAQPLRNNQESSFEEGFAVTGMLEKYKKLFFVMIRELHTSNLVEATGSDDSRSRLDIFRFRCKDVLDVDAETIANSAIAKYPAWADCFRFPLYCSKHLRKVLWGEMSPLSVIYPQGDLNFMYQFDKLGDLLGDVYYNMYMQLIAEYAQQLSRRGEKVRVLEVGAGVGHVTRQLLPKLKKVPNVEYWFTDLGKAFVENAKTLFSDFLHMMKFSTFDITKSAPKQGLFGSFDIVISYNVIHTTQSITRSVSNLKSCLGDDGTLFIIESARNDTWATLAWGILDGWWFFEDYNLRPADPMLEPDQWEQVLSKTGFQSVYSCPKDKEERRHVEKFLFLCRQAPADQLSENECRSQLGWWETDANRFDPVKTYDELDEDHVEEEMEVGAISVADRGKIQEELTNIWSELLGLDDVNPDDDFNALGGESLLAIQMMNLVRKRMGYQLEIADTFGYPTLNALSSYIADQLQEDQASEYSNSEKGSDSLPAKETYNSGQSHAIQPSTCLHLKTAHTFANGNTTLLMFPGQGAQKKGMCMSMKDSPQARAVFERAKQVLGYDLLEIFLRNDNEMTQRLKSTEFVQVSLLVSSVAKLEQLKRERPDLIAKVTHVAGLSVGEFAALVFAGVITFEDALLLVQERGRAMELEVQRSPTGMVSVFGLCLEKLQDHLTASFPKMLISTYLADNQHTVAGTNQECEALTKSLLDKFEEEIIDVRMLRVAGAFHSQYMSEASTVVDPIIQRIEFSRPSVSVIMNANGEVVDDVQVMKTLLREQLVSPVQWKKSVITAYELGVRHFVEVSPARVLSSIVKNRIEQCKDCCVDFVVV